MQRGLSSGLCGESGSGGGGGAGRSRGGVDWEAGGKMEMATARTKVELEDGGGSGV